MNTLPTRRGPDGPAPQEDKDVPSWRELRDRVADVMQDLVREGKELERDLEPKLLPALRKLKVQIEKLIGRLEERVARRGGAKEER
ncbi:MAG: hypothetical protein ACREMJ_02660 [Gemmatimonadales bacterium]